MSQSTLAILVTMMFSAIGVVGDTFLKLATIGVFYSVAMVVLLTAIGTIGFGERISAMEILGIAMGVGSLVILARFA